VWHHRRLNGYHPEYVPKLISKSLAFVPQRVKLVLQKYKLVLRKYKVEPQKYKLVLRKYKAEPQKYKLFERYEANYFFSFSSL
jgi:hypothetical protein